MKNSIAKLMNMFPGIKSADHTAQEWDAAAYLLDEESASSGMDRYPAMLVDAKRSVALAEWNWVSLPSALCSDGCAYMLSTRRI